MHLDDPDGPKRRRGTELEEALLEAAWAELVDRGYGAFTLEAVAQRAGTSRPVIARRWASKADLVRAAAAHVLWHERMDVPDTGNLRDDIVGLLREANEKRVDSTALLTAYLTGYFQETGTSPAEFRDSVIGGRATSVDVILDRAVARGELSSEHLTPRRRTLAFDLYRHEVLMRLGRVPDDVIVEIVDDLYLPLLGVARRP
ncbi:TetR family transcriptional regulator [Cellulomonas chitinilytica]|uniref:TetR family transcriptional regulator n=1 Tax=Cellulomonas chitinilytica TaxID=398759 RepID=A0A919U127_9CELL|nr:TetR/AcrR family transcriptional regulator [Cellulomonas chitinilytica]GIG22628.1 TetR family transcriptional regulator [Cellulomonas chitinilytica]